MNDYGYVMLACHLVILEIVCVYHIFAPQFIESSNSQVFRSSCIGCLDLCREFRRVCGARPASGVLGGIRSLGPRRKFRRSSEVLTQIYRVWSSPCFDRGLTPLLHLTVPQLVSPQSISSPRASSSSPRSAARAPRRRCPRRVAPRTSPSLPGAQLSLLL